MFTTEKLGPHCTLSQMNGISDQAASAADGEPITRLWEKEQFGAYDDIKILPTPKPSGVTNTADAASPSMRIKLRNAPKNSKAQSARPRTPAPVIAAPPARPQLSRKQILQNEIRNEQAALVREQAQLNVAKTNIRARKMYEAHGFRAVAHEPGCWSYIDHEGNWQHVEEPAWRMEKIIR